MHSEYNPPRWITQGRLYLPYYRQGFYGGLYSEIHEQEAE